MRVLGKAIAAHLRRYSGMYSVELPAGLRPEIFDLVSACNEDGVKRALFVSDEEASEIGIETTSWARLLRWRTEDDRIFVWERGHREPDTSFQSVVKPFISSHFPGSPGGECTLDLLAQLSIEELWRCYDLKPVGDVFDAFLETARWVAGVLCYSFERIGSTPSAHWSDEFLAHWAKMLNFLDQGMAGLCNPEVALQPRHAWELIRVAGLIVPARIAGSGNPFLRPPRPLADPDWPRLAKTWQDIVEAYILAEEDRAVLLTALDWIVRGSDKTNSWRDLDWERLKRVSSRDVVAAPVVGQEVFTAAPSPSLLSPQPPTYPVAPKPSWWGVTEADIQEALEQLQKETLFEPNASCDAFEEIPGQPSMYWLITRRGVVSHAHKSKRWRANVRLEDLKVVFRAPWKKLVVSHSQPSESGEGYAWICPDDLSLEVAGRGIETTIKQQCVSGSQLIVKFDLTVTYAANRDDDSGTISGKWQPIRKMRIGAKVRDCIDGSWESTPRSVDSSIDVVVPSPFSPTIIAISSVGKPSIAPGSRDDFRASLTPGGIWEAEPTPDIIIREEGYYQVSICDGRLDPVLSSFLPETAILVDDAVLLYSEGDPWFHSGDCELDEGNAFSVDEPSGIREIAIVKIRERSNRLSSGILSAVRGVPAGQRPPSTEARSTLPGRYQDQVTRALCNPPDGGYNSLYQYVISNSELPTTWPEHTGSPAPEFLFERQGCFVLPGIGNGPSSNLVGCPEWSEFMLALGRVCDAIGLEPGAEDAWLSGFDPSIIPAPVVQAYVEAQRNLVQTAKNRGQADRFWASYPFSVMIVEGKVGASLGQLLAVLLSPLHPARLAWAFAVAFTAKYLPNKHLIGLAEGWNIPYTGSAVSIAGQELAMVAIPTDPGTDQDFAAWSALAVLDRYGLARLPSVAAGLPPPWGGQTGINEKVVAHALRDYLAVHPHLNSLEVDIRSVSDAPRSREIDNAVLRLVGGAPSLDEVDWLGGGTRVQDSDCRLGPTPTRDSLFLVREEGERSRPFEWRRYQPQGVPSSADIAFIENSSVHLAITPGSTSGLLGNLPLRRFCPSALKKLTLEQNYSAYPGDDMLGLASLLVEIEYSVGSSHTALQAVPQPYALGVGMGGRWEILGTFNIDPTLLASIVAEQAQSSGKRLLWEWRPSWLGPGRRSDIDIAKRPYYVVGKVPASLLKALEYRQGFTSEQAFEMLVELGHRGIGLTSLHAAGGTQESATAGFFFAQRLLMPPRGHALAAKWVSSCDSEGVCGLIPLDPIEAILEELAGERLQRRADLLAVRISQHGETTNICLVPIEVKHHGHETDPEPMPNDNHPELKRAREQLVQTATVVTRIVEAIQAESSGKENFPSCYTRLLGLAILLELAMSLAPVPPTPQAQAKILSNVLNGEIFIGVGHPVLLWFAPGNMNISGQACDAYAAKLGDWDLEHVFIDPAAVRGLWWSDQACGPNEEETRSLFDEVMTCAFMGCTTSSESIAPGIKDGLAKLLELDSVGEVQAPSLLGDEGRSPASDEGVGLRDVSARPDEVQTQIAPAKKTDRAGQRIEKEVHDLSVESDRKGKDHQAPATQAPGAFLGWTSPTSRWSIIGRLVGTTEPVALDLDHPKTMGIFGYMGSGKSYLLGTIIEAALEAIPSINQLPAPLAVVIFNYRRNATDRFELSSLALPNREASDIERLAVEYGALPQSIRDIHILCLPGELTEERLCEYGGLPVSELFFDPSRLGVEDWELLMGEPGSSAVFARTIRYALRELRSSGEITLENLEHHVLGMLRGQSRAAAQLRFNFVRQHLSTDRGVDFDQLVKPGRAVIVDLRQPLFNKGDALRFFLVCNSYVSRVQGQFNKLVVFDEAHEYLSDEFGERMDARIRLMRHEGTSYIFATQDVGSIPPAVRRFITTRFVFNLGTRENVEDLLKSAPEFDGHALQRIDTGHCLVQANHSVRGVFGHPRLVHIRPRITRHGGASRIFSAGSTTGQNDND